MVDEHVAIQADTLIVPISDGGHRVSLVASDLDEHVVYVAVASPHQFEPIGVVGQ